MKTKGTRVSPKEIKRMVALYEELGSYAKVARRMRRAPDTVSRYVHQFYVCSNTLAAVIIPEEK